MMLVGMYDSPFVRRVAVTMKLLGMPFEHKSWSVGKDQAEIRKYNPLGRVPTLVLDDGEVLAESSAILDYLDDISGERALLPRTGEARRRALKLMAIATGAAEKGVSQVYELAFRPEMKRHQPWVERCRTQMQDALAALDRECSQVLVGRWLLGAKLSQADITVACASTFCHEALYLDPLKLPSLDILTARCEAMPEFQSTHLQFIPPAA